MIAVVIWEWLQPNPIINLSLFGYRNFSIAFVLMGLLAAILYGTLLMIPEFLQLMMGFNAEQAGATLWPTIFAVLPLLLLIAWLLNNIDARVLIVFGFPMASLAIFHIAHNLSLSINSIDATMFVIYL
ncbi:MAG: hypothetical protein JO166_05095, partial [Deltaproteobacteria bacterium]|nr:hypothetical protein [Deltaproteobacteria bacterium]